MEPLTTGMAPGNQGETKAGKQGIGVNTPSAAAVAVATRGFVNEVHMPKVGTLTRGLLLMVLPIGSDEADTVEITFKAVGVMPNEQVNNAVLVTVVGIAFLLERHVFKSF